MYCRAVGESQHLNSSKIKHTRTTVVTSVVTFPPLVVEETPPLTCSNMCSIMCSMLEISSRELQLNLGKYLSNLPIAITKYNKVVAKLVGVDEPSEDVKEYVKFLEGEVERLSVPEKVTTVTKLTPDDLRNLIADKGYTPVKCRWRFGCNEMSVALAEHGYWDNMESGEWVSQKAHLCQKHIDYVKKDKESK